MPYELFKHQRQCLDIAETHDRYGFFLDTGTGKTAVGLNLVRLKNAKTIVVLPLRVILAWLEDASNFTPELRVKSGWAKTAAKKRSAIQADDYDILLVNPDTFRSHEQIISEQDFDMLIFDESSLLKNHTSKITKAITRFAKNLCFVYLMSGTPAPNNLMEYWSQMEIIDPTCLQGSYWTVQNRYWIKPRADCPWLLVPRKKGFEEDFMKKVGLKSVSIKKADCLDLPDQIYKKEYVTLSPKQDKTYKTMLEDWIVENEDSVTVASNQLSQLMKLRQITAGFMYDENGTPIYQGKGKIEALLEILEENKGRQCLVFGQFRHEIDTIVEKLTEKKISCDKIYGGVDLKKSSEIITDFKSGECQVLVAHPKSVGHGLTFVNCDLTVWTSLDYSYETFYQANQRTHRYGQKNNTTHICLIAPHTIDEMIYRAVVGKEEMSNMLLDMIKLKGLANA